MHLEKFEGPSWLTYSRLDVSYDHLMVQYMEPLGYLKVPSRGRSRISAKASR